MLKGLESIVYSRDVHADMLGLWNREYPEVLAYSQIADLELYLSALQDIRHYLYEEAGQLKVWAIVFTRDELRWFAIIIDRSVQGKGYGSRLIRQMLEEEPELNGWVMDQGEYLRIDGTPYRLPTEFYKKLGFTFMKEHRLVTSRFSAVRIQLKRDE